MKAFDYSCVRLQDAAFAPRQRLLQAYLRGFDLDRLMHNFRVNASLPSSAVPLGGWESPECGLRGHFTGHFLSACAQLAYGMQDEQLAHKARQIVDVMQECARDNGYLSAFEESVLDTLERNETHGVWAPYYTLHKIMSGLVDCVRLVGYEPAKVLALNLALYIHGRFQKLSAWKIDNILRPTKTNPTNEFGGIGDALYSLWEITGEEKVLELARLYDRPYWIDPLAAGRDVLTNLHANTHLPTILAAAHRYNVTGEEEYRRAVQNFYGFLRRRTFANGNSSGRAEQYLPGELSGKAEHWGAPVLDASYLTGGESECCCAYNTEKLLAALLTWDGDMALLDHMEGLKYNALLNSCSANTGLSQYHQQMGRNQRKHFSSYDQDFWCCTGSGLETMAKLQDNIWFEAGDMALLNQFVSSDLVWKAKGVTLCLRSEYPLNKKAVITIHGEGEQQLTIALKKHRVSGLACSAKNTLIREENGLLLITGSFADGDTLTVDIASEILREPISSAAPEVYCYKYGPILLAGVKKDELQHDLPAFDVEGEDPSLLWTPWYLVEDEEYTIYSLPEDAPSELVEEGKQ